MSRLWVLGREIILSGRGSHQRRKVLAEAVSICEDVQDTFVVCFCILEELLHCCLYLREAAVVIVELGIMGLYDSNIYKLGREYARMRSR